MADSGSKIIGRWAAGTLCALAVSLAHAHPAHGRGAGWRAPDRPLSGRTAHAFVLSTNPYAHGGAQKRWAAEIAPAAAPLRPVSDHARPLAHEGGAAYMRAGSIRADIARYNEERDANRPLPHPPTEPAPAPTQSPSVYRN